MSTYKTLVFGDNARDKIAAGVDMLASAVKVTMGPSGQNVVIERPGRPPHLTKDGVTVAHAINLSDRFMNLGAQMVKEAAQRAAEIAGDGTTTATVLAQSMYSNGLRMIAAGFDPTELCRGMAAASREVENQIIDLSTPIECDEDIVHVGTISANGDASIGRLLCEAVKAVGEDGSIAVEEAKGFETSLDIVEGTQIERGYLSPYFVTNQDRMLIEFSNPFVLLVNKKITTLKEILPVLERVHESERPILIIADDVEGEALQGLVVNRLKGTLQVCAIRAPEFGDSRMKAFSDLGLLLGCKVFTAADFSSKETINPDEMGTCKKCTITGSSTLIIASQTNTSDVEDRVRSLRSQVEEPTLSDPEREALQRRISRLSGGIAVIRVGGATEVELRERKDRVEDALCATQAAIEEGIVPGGGVALVRAVKILDSIEQKGNEDYNCGVRIVKEACLDPLRQIVANTGGAPEVVLEKVSRAKGAKGYDARNETYVDMIESGIIDPAKVVKSAVHHASSAARNLLSVGCAMVQDDSEINEEKNALLSSN